MIVVPSFFSVVVAVKSRHLGPKLSETPPTTPKTQNVSGAVQPAQHNASVPPLDLALGLCLCGGDDSPQALKEVADVAKG